MHESPALMALVIVAMLVVYAAIGATLLHLGNRIAKLDGRVDLVSRLRRLHVLAVLAFLLGLVLTWMSFDTDHPNKYRHLLIAPVFVAVVYGFPVYTELKHEGVRQIARYVFSLFRR